MSWSYGKQGSQAEVKQYLDEEAPKLIAHVQGVERSIADQALGLLRAVVEADAATSKVDCAAAGSALIGQDGIQRSHNLNIRILSQ